MGMIKRILRQTSHKLMSKLGAQRNQLVLNNGELSGLMAQSMGNVVVNPIHHQPTALDQFKSSTRTKRTKRPKKNRHKNSSIPEALLLAAKNYLPPVQFHHIHGPNAQLSKNKCVARRTQSFCHALVFSNRVILPNERVYIKVLEIAKGWSGTIRFGFTSVDPATLKYQMPKHVCPDMTNAGHTWARALADEVVRRNSVIHFSYNTNGFIHYGINNQDCGVFHANVNTSQNLWFIVDIYGLTGAVELIDPRIHNASSELDLSRFNDDELTMRSGATGHNDRATMFKSTGAMDDLLSPPRSNKKKRNRKTSGSSRHPAGALIYEQWPHDDGLLMASPLDFVAARQHQLDRPILPNLSSIVLPTVQQNIYSPMPNILRPAAGDNNNSATVKPHTLVRPSNDSHDYYQIMTNHGHTNEPHHQHLQQQHHTILSDAELVLATRAAAAAVGTLSENVPPPMMPAAAASSSVFNSSLVNDDQQQQQHTNHSASVAGSMMRNANNGDEQEIRQQLDSFHMSDNNNKTTGHKQQHKQASSKSTKSTSNGAPVAVQRKRLQQQAQINSLQTSTNYKQRASDSVNPRDNSSTAATPTTTTTHSNTIASTATSTAITPKSSTKVSNTSASKLTKAARHSSKNLKTSPSFRDNNNNSPPSKDCPICFERPINCVLYQCGHMCTCYECGVKQWRTQSRTCPICRTVIKDVIKTYMS